MSKISVIGTGFVGSSIAYSLMLTEIAEEIALIDINETAVKAEAADIRPGFSFISPTRVFAGSWADTGDSDLIIVTAGFNRKADESRLDLIGKNSKIAISVADCLKANKAKAPVIVVSNPVDVMTRIIAERLDETDGHVFGTGCMLDAARFTYVLADFLKLPEKAVWAMVAGEHGAGQVLLWSSVEIKGLPLKTYLAENGLTMTDADKEAIAKRVAGMGAEIIKGKGRTHYGIAGCTAYLASVVLNNQTAIVPLTRPLKGELGFTGPCVSLPCVLTGKGVRQSMTDSLSPEEEDAIKQAIVKLDEVRI